MHVGGLLFATFGLFSLAAPALAADGFPETGSAKLAAYQVCRTVASVDMGLAGSQAATECVGIVRNLEGDKAPDNLASHCVEDTSARPEGYKYSGSCVLTDSDGDKLYMTYEGSKTGTFKWAGGTGKYQDIVGSGGLRVLVAPGSGVGQYAYTLNLDVSWSHKTK